MKIILSLVLILNGLNVLSAVPDSTITRLQKIYPERSREALLDVIEHSKSTFELWRAFPAYSYEMIERKFSNIITQATGLCAGDAHAENFGFIYSEAKKKTVFTINDLDDSAPCKLESDLLRLLAGNLFLVQDQTVEQLKSYVNGLKGEATNSEPIRELEAESLRKGAELSKKFKKLYDEGCSGDYFELSESELNLIKNHVEKSKRKFLRACSKLKESGGSAGLRRYVVFFEKLNTIGAFELKPLVTPAPLYITSMSKDERAKIYESAVSILFGEEFLNLYRPVVLKSELFLERPLIAGNVDIKLEDFNEGKLKKLLLLELHVLGLIHRKSKLSSDSIDSAKLQQLAQELHQSFKKEFGIP